MPQVRMVRLQVSADSKGYWKGYDGTMTQFEYKSSVLRIHDADDHDCVTCRFLSGDESREILLGVISNLDHMLSEKESLVTTLTRALT